MHAIRRSRRRSPPVPCLPLDEEAPFTNEDERVIARCGTFGYPRLGLPATKIPEDMDVWLSPRSKRKDSRGKGREVGRINPRLCTGTVSQVEGGTAKIRIPFSFFLFFFSLPPSIFLSTFPLLLPLFSASFRSRKIAFNDEQFSSRGRRRIPRRGIGDIGALASWERLVWRGL